QPLGIRCPPVSAQLTIVARASRPWNRIEYPFRPPATGGTPVPPLPSASRGDALLGLPPAEIWLLKASLYPNSNATHPSLSCFTTNRPAASDAGDNYPWHP